MSQGRGLDLKNVVCHVPEEIHHCEGCMHLMVYQWRPRQAAEEVCNHNCTVSMDEVRLEIE